MMAEGHKMNIVYFDPYPNKFLEEYVADYAKLLESKGEPGITIRKLETVDEVLQEADVGFPSSLCPHRQLDRSCYRILSHLHPARFSHIYIVRDLLL